MAPGDVTNEQVKAGTPQESGAHSTVQLNDNQSFQRLRDNVAKALEELGRLRAENKALGERIRELETRPDVDIDQTIIALDDNPDLLRAKVEHFIQTIDAYIAKEAS